MYAIHIYIYTIIISNFLNSENVDHNISYVLLLLFLNFI